MRAFDKLAIDDREGAFEDVSKAIQINPNDDKYFAFRADIIIDTFDLDQEYLRSIKDLDNAIDIRDKDPLKTNDYDLFYSRAKYKLNLADYENALKDTKKALEIVNWDPLKIEQQCKEGILFEKDFKNKLYEIEKKFN